MKINTTEYYKAFNFDLIQEHLRQYYKKPEPTAYLEIRNFFLSNNFVHRQGSGYLSKSKMTIVETRDLSAKLIKTFPWLEKCVKRIDITNVGDTLNMFAYFTTQEIEKLSKTRT
jgi:virulence-associated protein VapD